MTPWTATKVMEEGGRLGDKNYRQTATADSHLKLQMCLATPTQTNRHKRCKQTKIRTHTKFLSAGI